MQDKFVVTGIGLFLVLVTLVLKMKNIIILSWSDVVVGACFSLCSFLLIDLVIYIASSGRGGNSKTPSA